MTDSERRWLRIYALLLVVATTLPYLLGYFTAGEEWRFSGFLFAVEDGNSYIAKMRLGATGSWLFRSPYSAAEQGGVLAFLPYMLLGKLAAGEGMHEQLVALYHLLRAAAIFFNVHATYLFLSHFLAEKRWRRWATVMASVGGGLGWMLPLLPAAAGFSSLPLEFISPEAFGFLAILGIPHLVIARGLLLLGLRAYLREDWRAGLFLLLLAFFQPLAVISGYAVIAAHQVLLLLRAALRRKWRGWWRQLWNPLRLALISAPLVGVLGMQFLSDEYLRGWTVQNILPSPPPFYFVFAYGLAALPALAGVRDLIRQDQAQHYLPLGWVLLLPLLAYFPFPLQRRLPEGIWLAWLVLAAWGLRSWSGRSIRLRQTGRLFAMLSSPAAIILLIGSLQVALRPSPPAYLPTDEARMYRWLDEQAQPGEVVLAGFQSGNALPAWAGQRVIIGHGPESANLAQLETLVSAFYASDEPGIQEQLLRDLQVDYVIWGPRERQSGGRMPASGRVLQPIYAQDEYQIFRVEWAAE